MQKFAIYFEDLFQSTPPRGRRLCRISGCVQSGIFQSTPPRGRRLSKNGKYNFCVEISIHASAWEATSFLPGFRPKSYISIHASAWEATKTQQFCVIVYVISIHASAWEATIPAQVCCRIHAFQSTPPRGRRPCRSFPIGAISTFQSTPPRGRRLLLYKQDGVFFCISIHASAWEATILSYLHILDFYGFQSTPPRGRRQQICIIISYKF